MAVNKCIILFAFSCLCCVTCELNLSEDSPCITNGLSGTCVNIHRCTSAEVSNLYINAGFDKEEFKLPELPDICSYKNNTPVVCCTDCQLNEDELFVGPYGILGSNNGPVVKKKCLEYLGNLEYQCRFLGKIQVKKTWDEENKCHIFSYNVILTDKGHAQKLDFPHVALLGYGDEVDSAQWLCAGSVISERFILTAAHCTSTRVLGNISFAALGLQKRTDPKKDGKIHKVKRIIIHPEYKAPSKYHDIALLETETQINFGKDVLPACVAYNFNELYIAMASGWQRVGHRQDLADTLQEVELTEYNKTECAGLYQPHRNLEQGYDHEKQMCYGSHEKIIGTYEGDSGGPLELNQLKCIHFIVGVNSYCKDCGILGSAGLYTRVTYYVPWIESVVWPEETEVRKMLTNG